MRSGVGLGDLLRAWDAVGRDPAALAPLARMFDLAPTPAVEEHAGPKPPPRPPIETTKFSTGRDAPLPRVQPGPSSTERTFVESLPAAPPRAPVWSTQPARLDAAKPVPLPVPSPLFRVERERALLAATARRRRPDGGVDTEALADAIARRHFPRRLPRREVTSLRGGAQLIVDRSEWMQPFAVDIERIVERMHVVIGPLLQELVVDELPPFVRRPHEDETTEWLPPAAGTALVVISDLGRVAGRRGRRGPARAWRELLHIAQATLDPVVIVPGRKSAYAEVDAAFRDAMLLGWDREARVAELSRRGHRR